MVLNNYIIKIADLDELEYIFDQKIAKSEEPEIVRAQKMRRITDAQNGTKLYFFGYLGNEVICEANATISANDVHTQNIDKVVSEDTAYLSAFLTREDMRGIGYFSKLYAYMEKHLKNLGFRYLTLGVEPDEDENKAIYSKWGYNELIYEGIETFDGMTVEVEYYRKKIGI